jgi:hypothetical protein
MKLLDYHLLRCFTFLVIRENTAEVKEDALKLEKRSKMTEKAIKRFEYKHRLREISSTLSQLKEKNKEDLDQYKQARTE